MISLRDSDGNGDGLSLLSTHDYLSHSRSVFLEKRVLIYLSSSFHFLNMVKSLGSLQNGRRRNYMNVQVLLSNIGHERTIGSLLTFLSSLAIVILSC